MEINIFYQDLGEDARNKVKEGLLEELKEDIDEAIEQAGTENGLEKVDIANEVVDNYINTHNFAISYEI